MESIWLSFFGPFDLFVHLGGIYGIELLNQVKYITLMVTIWYQKGGQTFIMYI